MALGFPRRKESSLECQVSQKELFTACFGYYPLRTLGPLTDASPPSTLAARLGIPYTIESVLLVRVANGRDSQCSW